MESDWERRTPPIAPDHPLVALRLARALPGAVLARARPLGGGLCNTNLALELADGRTVVLRLHQREPRACRREAALLTRLAGVVPVPALLAVEPEPFDGGPPSLLLGFCPGRRLVDLPAAEVADGPGLGEAIGRVAAALHRTLAFETPGFLGDELAVVEPLGPGALLAYLRAALAGRAGARLGADPTARLCAWIDAREEVFAAGERAPVLAHSDFKPTNLLVARRGEGWEVTALLDWEFAWAGPGLLDLGQLLRHERELPPGFAAGVERGYLDGGGALPERWREAAAALDLLNLAGGFLDEAEERPRSQRDARDLVLETLRRWP